MKLDDLKSDCISIPFDLNRYLRNKSNNYKEFIRVWSIYQGEVVRRTFAYKTPKGRSQMVTEVMREIPTEEGCLSMNVYFTTLGGYNVAFTKNVKPNYYGYRPFDPDDWNKWFKEPKGLGMTCVDEVIDEDAYTYVEKYKHCGYQESCGDLLEYLRAYNKDPATEYFGKLGIKPEKSYMKLAKKDKQFVRFLKDNLQEVKEKNPEVVLYAYRNKKSIQEAADIVCKKRTALSATIHMTQLKGMKLDRVKIYEYMCENGVGEMMYDDYLEAIKELGLDLTDTKNLYPKDFRRMHDLRINEYESAKAKAKTESQKKFEEAFNKRCQEYVELEDTGELYQVIIPNHISDLIIEGDKLHHCVGKMGYDKKVIEGKSIIAFVRRTETPEIPYVTVEYIPDKHIISQVYGDHDSKPSEEVLKYVAKWEKKVTKILKERINNEKNCIHM